jgi:hypothetical protein
LGCTVQNPRRVTDSAGHSVRCPLPVCSLTCSPSSALCRVSCVLGAPPIARSHQPVRLRWLRGSSARSWGADPTADRAADTIQSSTLVHTCRLHASPTPALLQLPPPPAAHRPPPPSLVHSRRRRRGAGTTRHHDRDPGRSRGRGAPVDHHAAAGGVVAAAGVAVARAATTAAAVDRHHQRRSSQLRMPASQSLPRGKRRRRVPTIRRSAPPHVARVAAVLPAAIASDDTIAEAAPVAVVTVAPARVPALPVVLVAPPPLVLIAPVRALLHASPIGSARRNNTPVAPVRSTREGGHRHRDEADIADHARAHTRLVVVRRVVRSVAAAPPTPDRARDRGPEAPIVDPPPGAAATLHVVATPAHRREVASTTVHHRTRKSLSHQESCRTLPPGRRRT